MLKISKRAELPKRQEIVIRAVAVLFSLVCAGLVIMILGFNPVVVFREIVMGAIGTELRVKQTIIKAIPLIITSMGIMVAFKMKFWNIGGEGQIMMGAFGASLVALFGPADPKRTGPYRGHVVRKSLPCVPCNRRSCSNPLCMDSILPEDVIEKLDLIMR